MRHHARSACSFRLPVRIQPMKTNTMALYGKPSLDIINRHIHYSRFMRIKQTIAPPKPRKASGLEFLRNGFLDNAPVVLRIPGLLRYSRPWKARRSWAG